MTDSSTLDLALAGTAMPGTWIERARCRSVDEWIFFPGRGGDTRLPRSVCARCPVRDDCREYAIPIRELRGIWGGMTEADRKAERHRRAQPPPPQREPTGLPKRALAEALRALAQRPGEWARIAHFAGQHSAAATASQLRSGSRGSLPPGRWRFEGREYAGGGSDLYVICDAAELEAAS